VLQNLTRHSAILAISEAFYKNVFIHKEFLKFREDSLHLIGVTHAWGIRGKWFKVSNRNQFELQQEYQKKLYCIRHI
jgi:hypothetical protein